jgi:glycopeptide antibiotics resistance protein
VTKRGSLAARVAYAAIILLSTLAGLHFDPNLAAVPERVARALRIALHLGDAIDAARNVLLFAGLGAVWIASSRARRRRDSLRTLTIVSFCFSLGIELLQLFSPVRESSILDVTTNTLGGVLGGLITAVLFAALRRGTDRRSWFGVPAFLFAFSYGGAVLMEALIPLLRQAPQSWGPAGPHALLAMLVGEIPMNTAVTFPLTDVLIYLPAGVFAAVALIEANRSGISAWLSASAAGTVLLAAAEIAHGAIRQPLDPGAFSIHAASVLAGAAVAALWLAPAFRSAPERERVSAALIGYGVVTMVWAWRPFYLVLRPDLITEQFSLPHLIAMRSFVERRDLFTVTDVIAQTLIFVPIGALVAVWPLRGRGPLRGVLPLIYLSIVLESGKSLVAGRYVDVTHILIQSAGATMGLLLVRRTGYAIRGELLSRDAAS